MHVGCVLRTVEEAGACLLSSVLTASGSNKLSCAPVAAAPTPDLRRAAAAAAGLAAAACRPCCCGLPPRS